MDDQYCVVTGWMFMSDELQFMECICDDTGLQDSEEEMTSDEETDVEEDVHQEEGDDPEYRQAFRSKKKRVPSKAVREGLRYTVDDLAATSTYILVTPCEVNEEGELFVPDDVTRPTILNERTVTYVFDVFPSFHPKADSVYMDREDIAYGVLGPDSILISSCAFLILQYLIPKLEAHVFYELVLSASWRGGCATIPGVDYGPVQRTQGADVQWERVGDFDDFGEENDGDLDDLELQKRWIKLLTQEGKSDEEILEDAWMGRGNMWVYKDPGIFPIEKAVKTAEKCPRVHFKMLNGGTWPDQSNEILGRAPLLALPRELVDSIFGHLPPEDMLRLIFTTRILYGRFRAHLDRFTYVWIRRERPWYLPVVPLGCEWTTAEIDRWRSGWQRALTTLDREDLEDEGKKPWLAYYLACRRSPNMKSRERIWNIVLQIKGVLDRFIVDGGAGGGSTEH